MNSLTNIIVSVFLYIIQLLILFIYPYYKYRKYCNILKVDRTIGGLIRCAECVYNTETLLFVPVVGLLVPIVCLATVLIIDVPAYLYYNFIKNIKI